MATASVSDVGVEVTRKKISGRKDGYEVGEIKDQG